MSRRYALLYSSEDYAEAGRTPFCHADRELLTSTLTESCDFASADVISRSLQSGDVGLVNSIHSDLEAIRGRLVPGDTVLFYYAGHGTSVRGEPYLILPDTESNNIERTAIAIRDLSDKLRVDGVQCFRIFDSCHSGFDVRDLELDTQPMMRGVVNRPPDGWVTLAGCGPEEACHSCTIEGHGVFTYRLAQAIGEVKVNSDVRPEIVKVRTCDLVNEWCADSGKQQTPTLIATVRGNVSMATRRAPVHCSVGDIAMKDEAPTVVDVKSRLAELAREAPPGSDEYWRRYSTTVDTLRDELEQGRGIVELYAARLSPPQVSRIDFAVESIKAGLVDLVYKEGWCPIHRVLKEVEADNTAFASILDLNPFSPQRKKPREIKRELSQDYGTPDSTVTSELEKDGVFPGLRIIHYVCPLQSRFLIYSRIEVAGVMAQAQVKSHNWYRTVDTSETVRVKEHASFVLEKAREMYYEACEINIRYLESEQA